MTATFSDLLQAYLPRGSYSREPDALHVLELGALAEVLETVDDLADDLLDEFFPLTATATLDDWERNLDLHPATGASAATRRGAILEVLRRHPNLSPPYIAEQLASLTGLTPAIIEHLPFLCDDAASLCDAGGVEQQWTFYAAFSRAAAAAAGLDVDLVDEQLVLEQIEPAHALGLACYDDFRCDDPYSQVDRDLLGA